MLTHTPQRLTVPVVDEFIADLKDAIREARTNPSGKGTMVALYGKSSILPPTLASHQRSVPPGRGRLSMGRPAMSK